MENRPLTENLEVKMKDKDLQREKWLHKAWKNS